MKRNLFVFGITFLLVTIIGIFVVTKINTRLAGSLHNNLTIVCSTSMITESVQQIVGKHANVIGLMGPGIDPHLYRAKAGDVQKIASADIIFYNGLHLEGKMTEIFEKLKRTKPTVAVADVIPQNKLLESEFRGIYDPHVWHDVLLWKQVVIGITQTLCKLDPERQQVYNSNKQAYCKQLDLLNKRVQKKIEQLRPQERILVTAHDAFGYFGKAYGFEVVGLQGISTDAEISTKDIENLVTFIASQKIRAVFIESSIAPRSMQALINAVAARGWQIELGSELFSDALGDSTTGANSYSAMIEHNVSAIVSALRER